MSARKAVGSVFTAVGMLLVLASLALFCYNLCDDSRAGSISDSIVEKLAEVIESDPDSPSVGENDPNAEIFDSLREMPTIEIDGVEYIGVISIPAIDRELPVQSEWSYSGLKTSPCRYSGTTYMDNLVICAHNYQKHFGTIKNLLPDDAVYFTDADGVVWEYKVVDVLIYNPTDVDKVVNSSYDLMLFTCTYSGKTRVAVGCELV